ncbi:MAG: sigma-70 family RNA polymerase sigma factor [Kiritimatiellae bacterium]|nr:sigma-70 family RNA polymerase sigma factor [Kiritimatiellia bacterium]
MLHNEYDYTNIDEQDIINRVQTGETDCYEVLVKKYQQKAFQIAYGVTSNYDDAKDAAHEAFISAFKAIGTFKKNAKFSSWLYTIVVNKSKDKLRVRQRNYRMVYIDKAIKNEESESFLELKDEKGKSAVELLELKELGDKIQVVLESLPDSQRTAFTLHHINGFALAEVAGIMGKGLSTIKTHVRRATLELRNRLDGEL